MIEMGKKYRTCDGREVRIYAVDAGGPKPVHGARRGDAGNWVQECWTIDGTIQHGTYAMGGPFDLVEVLPEVTVRRYLSQTDHGLSTLFSSVTPSSAILGTLDITHNGKEIIRVEVVK